MRTTIRAFAILTPCISSGLIVGCCDDGAGPTNPRPQITSLTAVTATDEPSGQCAVHTSVS